MRSVLTAIRTNVTAKVCFFVFVTAAGLLALLGAWYLGSYEREVERGLAARLALPAALMSEMALNFDAVTDLAAIGQITQEPVVEAFVARREGVVFYASDPGKVGRPLRELVGRDALERPSGGALERRLLRSEEDGRPRIALLTPLSVGGEVVGRLFVKIDGGRVAARHRRLVWQLVLGGAASVCLIVFIAGFWVQRLLVPRISRTVAALQRVEEGRLETRIRDHGVPDQIGALMRNVDAMIEQVDARDRALRSLAKAAEDLANVEDEAALRRTVAAVAREAGGVGDDLVFRQTLRRLEADARRRVDALEDLRCAEKEYRDLFSGAVEGIFRVSTDGRMLAANPALARMLGFDTAAALLGRFPEILEGTRGFAADWAAFVERVRAEGVVRDWELMVRRGDGELLWVSLSGRALWDASGAMTAVEGSAVDVSERKRREAADARRVAAEAASRATAEVLAALEEKHRQLERTLDQLRCTQERLVQSEKMAAMGTMAAGVAHDLNNILSGIVSYPDLLLMQLSAESPWRESLSAIRESGQRAAAVVADLLTIARGAAYATAPCDLSRLVERHLGSPEHRQLLARFPRVRVETRLAGDLRSASCSEVHMRKVLMNLVMNACEAVHDEGRVVVSTENRTVAPGAAPGEYVALAVADTGPGIAEKDLGRVFEPFFSKKVLGRSGTGLGLAVVWNTVQEHRGTVTAESGAAGATFTVLLPACAGADGGNGGRTAQSPPAPPSREAFRGTESVLVVDDEAQLRLLGVRILGALGYRVEAVSSGEEAVERLREQPFDLVLLDMLMSPGMNGGETYRRLAALRPGQKAVICSGYALGEDFLETQRIGAGSFLKKPYTLEELAQAVRRELDRPS